MLAAPPLMTPALPVAAVVTDPVPGPAGGQPPSPVPDRKDPTRARATRCPSPSRSVPVPVPVPVPLPVTGSTGASGAITGASGAGPGPAGPAPGPAAPGPARAAPAPGSASSSSGVVTGARQPAPSRAEHRGQGRGDRGERVSHRGQGGGDRGEQARDRTGQGSQGLGRGAGDRGGELAGRCRGTGAVSWPVAGAIGRVSWPAAAVTGEVSPVAAVVTEPAGWPAALVWEPAAVAADADAPDAGDRLGAAAWLPVEAAGGGSPANRGGDRGRGLADRGCGRARRWVTAEVTGAAACVTVEVTGAAAWLTVEVTGAAGDGADDVTGAVVEGVCGAGETDEAAPLSVLVTVPVTALVTAPRRPPDEAGAVGRGRGGHVDPAVGRGVGAGPGQQPEHGHQSETAGQKHDTTRGNPAGPPAAGNHLRSWCSVIHPVTSPDDDDAGDISAGSHPRIVTIRARTKTDCERLFLDQTNADGFINGSIKRFIRVLPK